MLSCHPNDTIHWDAVLVLLVALEVLFIQTVLAIYPFLLNWYCVVQTAQFLTGIYILNVVFC
jgi:hypothetical protein